MSTYLLAHDLGTSGNKAILFDTKGNIVSSATVTYPISYSNDGHYVEQDPMDWWKAFCESSRLVLNKVLPSDVAAVAVSGQMMACLAVDAAGNPLRPCMIWADTRAEAEAAILSDRLGREPYYRITGNWPSANYTAEKILWLMRNQPEIYQRAHKFLQPKDFITMRLTGRFTTDTSDAGHMHLYDVFHGEWSAKMIEALGMDADKLPEIVSAGMQIGTVAQAVAEECGLKPGTPVVQGAGDGRAAMLGTGVWDRGESYICLGSSSWFCQTSDRDTFDISSGLYKGVSLREGYFINGGTMQAGGLSLDWFAREIAAPGAGAQRFEIAEKQALSSPPGANGILYLPYLLGERAPYFDSEAKAAFVGLKAETVRADMTRAVLEGVAMHLALIMHKVEVFDCVGEVRIVGGGARSRIWRQIIADVLNKTVLKTNVDVHAGSLGTAMLAGKGVGVFDDLSVVKQFHTVESVSHPNMNFRSLYSELQTTFEETYQVLRHTNHRLSK